MSDAELCLERSGAAINWSLSPQGLRHLFENFVTRTRSESKKLPGAVERSIKNRWSGAELERSALLKTRSTAPRILNPAG